MRLRGVLQSLQSAAERILLGRPRETMSKAPGKTRPVAALPSAGALPDTARGSSRHPVQTRPGRGRGLALLGLRHLSDPHRPHAHRADAWRGGGRAAHQRDARLGDDRHHRLAGDRAVARSAAAGRRRAAACPHRQPVQRHRRRAGDRCSRSLPASRSIAASITGSPFAPNRSSRTRSTWRRPICKSTAR